MAPTEEYWNAADSCWLTRQIERPASDWADTCGTHIDTAPRWAYDLYSDADGNCARLAVNCDPTDAFYGPCDAVADCCDDAKLANLAMCP